MKDLLIGLAALIFGITLVVIVYFALGAIFYFALPVLGVDITFGQGVVLAILIMVTGALFRGGRKQTKGDE